MPSSVADIPVRHAYFFDRGLCFSCRQCGDCCTGAPGTIYVGRHEIAPIAGHLGLPAEDFVRDYLYPCRDSYSIGEDRQGNCLFYKGKCAIYEARPSQCRSWPFWFSNLRSENAWRRAASRCPGIGSGRLYGREEIISHIHENLFL